MLPALFGAWLRRRPLSGYFALTFALSWGGILIVLTATGFDLSAPQPAELALLFVLMLLGPSVGGLTMIALTDGRIGLHALWSSLLRWRVGASWYAVALLAAPILLLSALLPLSALVSPAFTPSFHWQLLAVGLIAGAFEEIGWTGFVTPQLLKRHSAWMAGLALGLVWAIWHLLVDLRYNAGALGGFWVFEFAIVYVATLTPYRILMTWVYEHTGSLLLSVLMHASFTGSLLIMVPATTFAEGLVWQAIFSGLLWVAAAWIWLRSPLLSPRCDFQCSG